MSRENQNRLSLGEFLNYLETKKTKIVFVDWHKYWAHFHIWTNDENGKTYIKIRVFAELVNIMSILAENKVEIFIVDDYWRQ